MVLSDIDRRLLSRCIEGTPGAWEDFVERFIALITHVVTATSQIRVGELSSQSRDDIVADIFLSLVENDFAVLRRFRGQSSLGTYLVVISRRIAVRRLAQLNRVQQVSKAIATEPISSHGAVEHTLEINEEVHSLLTRIPETEATAIRMFHLEERSYHEIGMHMGIPENSVGPLLSKARSRLRELRN